MTDKTIRVLFIEDDRIDRMAFERLIENERLAYDYSVAESTAAAKACLSSGGFDIIISDYNLGDGTCLDLFKYLGDTPMIVVTGTGDEETAVAAMKLGASDYLIKDPEGHYLKTLAVTVDRALERKRASKELQQYREHLEELVSQRTAELEEEIEAREKAEEERITLERQLHQAQKMEAVGQLAGGVAHDFNNLLTVIFANLHSIQQTLPQEMVPTESLRMIEEAAEQASGVTRSLLTFSRKVPAEKKVVMLSQVVAKATRLLGRALPASIELVVDVPDEPPLRVNADATQIQQVVMNLAINARDAMPKGGTLTIAVKPSHESLGGTSDEPENVESASARLIVSDTGTGMTPEVKHRIFEPFFTTKPREHGTGLGLSIIHGIVKDHGGQIEVESEVGQGTTFLVKLPCTALREDDGSSEQPPPSQRGAGELILVGEDHQYVRQLMTSALASLGYQVIEASDGEELMAQYERHAGNVRVIIADVDMPKRNGLECLRMIRERDARQPVMLTTGNIDVDLETQCAKAHAPLLRKPFQISALTRLVANLLTARAEENA